MTNTHTGAKKIFHGFAILTVLCGLYAFYQKQYIEGICGASVGAFLVYLTMKNQEDVDHS